MEKKPKIAIFLPSLSIGGVERNMLNLAAGLIKCGVSVDLVLASAKGEYLNKIPKGVKLIDLKSGRIITSIIPLVSYLRKQSPVGLISAKDYANIIAIISKYISGISTYVIVSVRTTLSKHVQYAKGLKEKIIVPFLARLLYPYADKIVAVSKGVAEDIVRFLKLPPDLVTVIYNPVLSEELFTSAWEQIDHPWFNKEAPPVIISIGRLTIAKNYQMLIYAFAKVKQHHNVRLVILGDGEEKARLQELIKRLGLENDVWLPGFVDPPYPYLARSSLFVLSSIWEGLSTAIIEAIALGVPVVSTDCPSSPREILADGLFGELVPCGDVDALADAIVRALGSPHDPDILKNRAKQFSVYNSVYSYLSLLRIKVSSLSNKDSVIGK